MATYDLGKVVGDAGEKGDDGSTVWNTSTAPTYANNKYTFTISNLSGKTGLEIAVNDIIFYSTYYYIVSAVNTTTVDCSTRVSIKGSDASVTIVDNLTSTSSTSALSAKQGKVLNDNKIETSSIATTFGSILSDTKVPSEKLIKNSLDAKADASSLATVATTGDYDDLTDKPTIPSASTTTPSADTASGSYGSGTSYARSNHTHPKSSLYAESSHTHTVSNITDFPSIPSSSSDLSDGSNIVKKSSTSGLLKNDGTVDTTSYLSSLPSHNHDDRYYTESEVDTALSSKQATLVSGTNIKTINNNSLLGSGNITIEGGGGSGGSYINDFYGDSSTNELVIDYDTGVSQADIVTSWSSTPSDTNVPSEKLVKEYIDNQIGTAIQYIQQ